MDRWEMHKERKRCFTSENGPSLVLVFNLSVRFSLLGEWRLIHKPPQIVAPLKVSDAFLQLPLIKVRSDIGHLDVGQLRIQILGIYL